MLRYQLLAVPERLSLPASTTPVRADGLWRTTCAEAFVCKPDVTGYVELNFSPSTQWAAYQFDDYRQGMTPLAINAPQIVITPHDHALEIAVTCALPPSMANASSLLLGLSMVVADQQGGLSYWALHHAADKPDFHHRDGFVLEL